MADQGATVPWAIPGVVWTGIDVLCHEIVQPSPGGIWASGGQYFLSSHKTMVSAQITIILVTTTIIGFILRPLRFPFISQVIAGIIVGLILGGSSSPMFHSAAAKYILRTLSYMGFQLYAFTRGVETSRNTFKAVEKKSILVGVVGLLASFGVAFAAYSAFRSSLPAGVGNGMLLTFNVPTFFMVVCNHLNDLGISNSELGQFAAAAALVVDILGMILTFIGANIVVPLVGKGKLSFRPGSIIVYYCVVFFMFRPLIMYIINLTPEGRPVKQSHFLLIIVTVLMMAFVGELVDERFATFIFAFTLPEEPLGSILNEKLDPINNAVFFPIFCALHGMKTNIPGLTPACYVVEIILLAGYVGKFFGTFITSIITGFNFSHSIALALVMSSKGLMDVALIGVWGDRLFLMGEQEYTVAVMHIIVFAGLFLPLVRLLYVPSRQYSTILRRSVIESCENGSFHALTCIYKEENVPGLIHILEVNHPTRSNPLSVIALQLMQLTGRAALPFMGPLDQVTSSSAFRSNLARCNRVVTSFLHFERENKGNAFIQHYVAVSPYATMHNDICQLAYDKGVNLIIVPFHAHWDADGNIVDPSLPIREVNNKVLEKAPCSVGLLVDRGLVAGSKSRSHSQSQLHPQPQLRIDNADNVYRIAVLFAGGSDDHEALAYSRLLATHPRVRVVVVWLKGPQDNDIKGLDHDVMMQFRQKCLGNVRMSFREAVVNDGAEMTQVVVSIKDAVDLVLVGKHHDPKCPAVYGLCDGLIEYPELGVIGDMLASSEFGFSILVVQHEQRSNSSEMDIFDM